MIVYLYNCSNDPRQLVKQPVLVAELNNVEITDNCNIENPDLLINRNDAYIGCNYVYIPVFNRYYFITDIDIINGNQFRIRCHVDVLMSHKNAIRSAQIIASRSASNPDPYIIDNLIGDKGTIQVFEQRLTDTPFTGSSDHYVLHIAGK